MERDIPAWQPFRPGEPGPRIPLSDTGPDASPRVLLLVGAAEAVREGWAPRAAVALARQHASEGGRTLLADLDLRDPRLHDVLGVVNDEGMSDVFLWGASFQRVAHQVEPGLLFAPAGTVVADLGAVAESPRWDAVMDGFRQARATLVLYTAKDSPMLEDLVERASDVVLLATREEASGPATGVGGRGRVRAVLGPPAEEPVGAAAAGVGAAEAAGFAGSTAGTEDAATTTTADVDGIDRGVAGGAGEDHTWEDDVSRVVSAAESRPFRPLMWLVLAVVVVVVAVAAAAWLGWVRVPYLTPPGGTEALAPQGEVVGSAPGPSADSPVAAGAETTGADAAVGDETPPAEPGGVAPTPTPVSGSEAPLQRFSLTLAAYPDADSALAQVSSLSARRPDVLFTVAPVEVEGRTYHRLLAGLAADAAGVEALRASLAGTLGEAEAERWIVRAGGQAFLLGEVESLEAARARATELAAGALRPYVLEVVVAGASVYRIYAGAYASAAEASAMDALLEARGLGDAPLTQRVGRLPG